MHTYIYNKVEFESDNYYATVHEWLYIHAVIFIFMSKKVTAEMVLPNNFDFFFFWNCNLNVIINVTSLLTLFC